MVILKNSGFHGHPAVTCCEKQIYDCFTHLQLNKHLHKKQKNSVQNVYGIPNMHRSYLSSPFNLHKLNKFGL